jgi:hypothetical protein
MHLTRRSCAGPLLITLAVFLVLLATPAIAQEAGVRKLEDYREVSPFYEVPVLTTGYLSFRPESEIDLGFGRLFAFLGERILYEDNVYLSKNHTTSDVSFNTTPGVFAEMFSGEHRLRLFYAPTFRNYLDETDLNTVNHDANIDLRLDFVDSYFRIADTLTMTQDTATVSLPGRVDRTTNRAEAEVGTLFGDLGVGVRGRWHTRTYGSEIPDWQDLTEMSLGFFGRWTPHVDYALLLEYDLLKRRFHKNVLNDSTTHTILAGVEGRPVEYLDYFAKAGLASVRAEDNGDLDDDSDLDSLALEAELRLRMDDGLAARLWYVQRPEYASFSNYQKAQRGGLTIDVDLDPGFLYLRGQGYMERADPSNEPSFKLYSAGLAVGATALTWLKAELGWEWTKRLGQGSLNYDANKIYLQIAIYF